MTRGPIARELQRKAFHLLSLAYLGVYKLAGWPRALHWMLGWSAVVAVVETWRLLSPKLNAALTRFFGGLARDEEADKFSGILHTTFGVLIVFWAFGDRAALVAAAIYCVAFGDMAAALVGTLWGRHRLIQGKSLEGTAACLATCFLAVRATGFAAGPAALAAAAAALVELVPTSRWFNDNMWMPVVTAGVLRLCAGS